MPSIFTTSIHTQFATAFCFAKRRKSEEKMILHRKIGFTIHPISLNPGKAIAMAICPIIVYFHLALALKRDMACEFACVVRMRRNN